MRNQTCVTAIAIMMGSLAVYGHASDGPTTRPAQHATTQPASDASSKATFSVRGRVSLASGLDFAPADLSRVVVFFESEPALDAPSSVPARATVGQRHKAFIPNFLAISKGTVVEFPNWDHISHNVFSRSAAAPAFDLDRYPYGQSKSRTFDKVGVVQVFCNIHPWMRAIIFVTPNRFFTTPDAKGHFVIDGVPAGHYQISAWQERCATQHQSIDVGSPNDAQISLVLAEDRGSIIANDPPRHGQDYGVDRGLGLKRERLNLPVVTESHPAPTTEPQDSGK